MAEKQEKPTPKANESSKSEADDPVASPELGGSGRGRAIRCNSCHKLGHIARYCRSRFRRNVETPGRSRVNTPKTLATTAELTDEQLAEELAKHKLEKEKEMLDSAGSVQVVTGKAIGPTMVVDVEVEGVLVSAVVDTGSQLTIISRPFLHKVKRHLESKGESIAQLELTRTAFYGMSGTLLEITARVNLSFSLDGNTVQAPVFIQPHSEQDCLLGSNVLGPLGITVCRASGEIMGTAPQQPEVASVSLVQTVRVPRKTGLFAEAEVEGQCREGEALVFEHGDRLMADHGLISHDSLVTVRPGNKIFVPLHNEEAFSRSIEKNVQVGTVVTLNERQMGEVEISSCNSVHSEPTVNSAHKPRHEQLLAMLNLPKDELSVVEYEKIRDFLCSNMDVFALDDTELGCTSLVQHEIDTGEHSPMKQHFRRVPFVHREKISQMVDDMLEKGIIQPSSSPWASPIVLVPKKDGQLRFCVDYRRLNSVTKKDQYPLPRIEDILDSLGEMHYFSTLDLASGYWQIEMGEEARQKSAFVTHRGLHEFVRMPFGLCNAPATFQRLMEVILDGILWKECFVYIDDVLVCSKSPEEHLVHLTEVFERFRKANLRLKPKKCMFLRPKVPYLGHIISREGVSPDTEKVDKVKYYPIPASPTEVRQFLGLASYYRRFMKDFAKVAKPLYSLTCKDAEFKWTRVCQDAFEALKRLLVTAPVLAYPQFGEGIKFVLETDASTSGLGAVLSQKQQDGRLHPVAYASRKLQPAEENYAITELETLGIVWAVKYFRPYLLGHKVIVYSDIAACMSLLNCSNPSPKLARWAMIVQEMDLTIKHRSGKNNANADTLSRLPYATKEPVGEPESLSLTVKTPPDYLSSCEGTAQHIENGAPCELESRNACECGASEGRDRGSIPCLTHVCSVSLQVIQITDSESYKSMIRNLVRWSSI